ncbi:NusG domain II-containing protein [Paenibacillus senegalimassiliensis]|uniref:NusG domain II-containing protein n=1 Tax=Paenibacillus senegalimassiliensis TaxID=1737426 RepID=UPI00073E9702|nr:NusG domain II-containing protein [Paenibacillus senegalimassiliensis]
MKRGDILLIGLIVAVALVFLVPRWLGNNTSENNHNNEERVAKITVDGKLFKTVALTGEEQTIDINTEFGYNQLKVHSYGIEMIDADCPDKVCLTFGFIDRNGGTIVCLPHKLMVEVVATGGGDDVDALIK